MEKNSLPQRKTFHHRLLLAGLTVALLAPAGIAQSKVYRLEPGRDPEVANRDWQLEDAPVEGSSEWLIAEARRLIIEGNPGRARRMLTEWLEPRVGSEDPLLPAALLARGDALVASGEEFRALFDYEELLREHPGSEEFERAVERELAIALRYADGLRRRAWGIRAFDASDIAIELLIRVQERMPGSQLAERAAIELADFYYKRREIALASEAYSLYLENFPDGPNARHASRRRIYADIARFKGPEYDASGLLDAQVRIRRYQQEFPADAAQTGLNSGLIERLNESLAAQQLVAAEYYLSTNELAGARLTLQRLIDAYPRTSAALTARSMLEDRGWKVPQPKGQPAPESGPIIIEGPADAVPLDQPAPSIPDSGSNEGDQP
ncbi:MAG: outer membrane protein assembly factor BamD [Phycisphaerales bacterium JB065]